MNYVSISFAALPMQDGVRHIYLTVIFKLQPEDSASIFFSQVSAYSLGAFYVSVLLFHLALSTRGGVGVCVCVGGGGEGYCPKLVSPLSSSSKTLLHFLYTQGFKGLYYEKESEKELLSSLHQLTCLVSEAFLFHKNSWPRQYTARRNRRD